MAPVKFAVDEARFDERTVTEFTVMELGGNDLFTSQIQRFENDFGVGGP
jgi:hypothetical protein